MQYGYKSQENTYYRAQICKTTLMQIYCQPYFESMSDDPEEVPMQPPAVNNAETDEEHGNGGPANVS